MTRIVTLIAAPLGSMLPGRPVDWDQLPPDARAWADAQVANDNEMLTALDGDHRVELQDSYDVYAVRWSDQHEPRRGDPSIAEAIRFAIQILDPEFSPQAFRRGDAAPAVRETSMWRGTDEALSKFGLRRGAPVSVRDLAAALCGRLPNGTLVLPAGSALELVLTAPNSLSFIWSQDSLDRQMAVEDAMLESAAIMVNYLVKNCPVVDGVQPARSFAASLVSHAVGTLSAEVGTIPPMLHVHCCLIGVLADDGTMSAPHEATLRHPETRRLGNAVGEAELASRVRTLGYPVEPKADPRVHTFEIAGVPQELLEDADFWRNTGCAVTASNEDRR